ncbi:hypothetical protein BKA63DRAFT_556106 [Paraphoma chrysanthemicola]|nr:hypothetical protein BKA63DRAFT_556106 [Paraphoma chrysanthemicola]
MQATNNTANATAQASSGTGIQGWLTAAEAEAIPPTSELVKLNTTDAWAESRSRARSRSPSLKWVFSQLAKNRVLMFAVFIERKRRSAKDIVAAAQRLEEQSFLGCDGESALKPVPMQAPSTPLFLVPKRACASQQQPALLFTPKFLPLCGLSTARIEGHQGQLIDAFNQMIESFAKLLLDSRSRPFDPQGTRRRRTHPSAVSALATKGRILASLSFGKNRRMRAVKVEGLHGVVAGGDDLSSDDDLVPVFRAVTEEAIWTLVDTSQRYAQGSLTSSTQCRLGPRGVLAVSLSDSSTVRRLHCR